MLESELGGARVFVDEFKARLQEQWEWASGDRYCGGNRAAKERAGISRAIGRFGRRFDHLQWGFMKHDGQVLQGAASSYGILMRPINAANGGVMR